jgi:hypothetical protein
MGIGALGVSGLPELAVAQSEVVPAFYGLDKFLSRDSAKQLFKGSGVESPTPSAGGAQQHMLFYYDKDKGFVNPFNLTPDPQFKKEKKYSLSAKILNFHTSPSQDKDIWKDLRDDLQLQLSVTSTPKGGEELTWVAMSAIRVFLNGKKSGTDQRLQGFQTELDLTKDFSGSSKISIEDGV